MIKLSINDRYFFDEHSKPIIPTIEELVEYYQLTNRIYAVKEPFPYEGYAVKGCEGSYRTREEAETAAEKIILSIAKNYKKEAKICSAK